MSKLRVHCLGVSLDGFAAGPDQSIDNPLGVGGEDLHRWFIPTRFFQKMYGKEEGTMGVDNDFAERSMEGVGAWIMGRNMFGPIRGEWPDDKWKGWWGDNPPYHSQVFVLTHHPRESVQMEGGTTFHFVTEGIRTALDRAREAAGDLDVQVGGGASTIRQYLQEGLIDHLHLGVSPLLLGSGESLFAGIDLLALGYRCTEHATSPDAMHVVLEKASA
jgi:dihydrofolate reductase